MSLSPTLVELNGTRAAAVALYNTSGVQLDGFDGTRGSTGTLTQLAYAAGSQVALPANPARRRARFFNGTNKTIYIALNTTCSTTAYTDQIPSLTSWETDKDEYTGDISVVWSGAPSAGPKLQVTEIT